MAILNGRLDDPMAWLDGVSDDQYRAIEAICRSANRDAGH